MKLVKLGHFLKYIYEKNDILPLEFYRKQFESNEIKIKENTYEKTHKKKNSENF